MRIGALERCRALQEARRALDDTREEVGDQFGPDFSAVFHTHIQILEDKGFVAKLREEVRETGNAYEALRNVLEAYRRTFARIEDPYFRDRIADVEDVGRRVMEQMLGERRWCVGEAMSLADIAIACHLGFINLRQPKYFPRERYPRLTSLWARLEQRDSFRKSAPPAA